MLLFLLDLGEFCFVLFSVGFLKRWKTKNKKRRKNIYWGHDGGNPRVIVNKSPFKNPRSTFPLFLFFSFVASFKRVKEEKEEKFGEEKGEFFFFFFAQDGR